MDKDWRSTKLITVTRKSRASIHHRTWRVGGSIVRNMVSYIGKTAPL